MSTPARFSAPPFPCTVEILTAWLNARHHFTIPEGTRLSQTDATRGVLGYVQGRYQRVVPTENEGGVPWPSEVWDAVLRWEREAGQPSLFEAEGVAL